MLGKGAAKRLKVPPCLRRSGYAQAGVKVLQHTQLPFGTFFMQLARGMSSDRFDQVGGGKDKGPIPSDRPSHGRLFSSYLGFDSAIIFFNSFSAHSAAFFGSSFFKVTL